MNNENNNNNNNRFENTARKIGNFLNVKNKSYGNSFEQTEEFIKMLYHNGIKKEQYLEFLFFIRIFDKLKRIAVNKDAFNENPFFDILGLVIRIMDNKKEFKNEK